jgi:uncharacterized membrane protein
VQISRHPGWLRALVQRDQQTVSPRQRAVIALSLVGIGSMSASALLQTGLLRHLPDPPLPGFNSDKVNLSREAFPFGVPDGTLGVLSFAANLPLAGLTGANSAWVRRWALRAGVAKAIVDTGVALWYLYQMPAREKAWCVYCLAAQVCSLGILVLTLQDARETLRRS